MPHNTQDKTVYEFQVKDKDSKSTSSAKSTSAKSTQESKKE